MNKEDFIRKLGQCLKHIPKEDREDAIRYYTEYFEEMDSDGHQGIGPVIGSPEDIAKEIIANCTEKHIDRQKENGGIKNSATAVWMIILAIFASPVAVPLALGAVTLLIGLLLIVLAFILSLLCMGAALAASSVLLLFAVFFSTGIGQKFVCLGFSFIFLGLGTLILIASIRLGEACIHGIAELFNKLIFRKKVA